MYGPPHFLPPPLTQKCSKSRQIPEGRVVGLASDRESGVLIMRLFALSLVLVYKPSPSSRL